MYEIKKILFDRKYNNENTYVILDYQKIDLIHLDLL